MEYLNFPEEALKTGGGYQTAAEISRQPEIWRETAAKFFRERQTIAPFIRKAAQEADQILLTGAGSSSFTGYSLSGLLFNQFKKPCHVVPTTDIVTFPGYYFNAALSCLIISFARSGESPESVAALALADRYSKKCFHLIVTCDGSGALAGYRSKNPVEVFVLPPGANDKALAMTGSYTSMLLSGLLMALWPDNEESSLAAQVNGSIEAARQTLGRDIGTLRAVAHKAFRRAVFLGSGALYGTATEAALKLQELTNGSIICKSDTFLGFRHGPKAVINEDTLVVYFFNQNRYANRYEMDLVRAMDNGTRALFQLGIGSRPVQASQLNGQIIVGGPGDILGEDFQPLNYIVPAQLLGFFKSMQLGLKPDTPSLNGAISRVVKGVHIYPLDTN